MRGKKIILFIIAFTLFGSLFLFYIKRTPNNAANTAATFFLNNLITRNVFIDPKTNNTVNNNVGKSILIFIDPKIENDFLFFIQLEAEWSWRKDLIIIAVTNDSAFFITKLRSYKDINCLLLKDSITAWNKVKNINKNILYILFDETGRSTAIEERGVDFGLYSNVQIGRFVNGITPSSLRQVIPIGKNAAEVDWLRDIYNIANTYSDDKNILIAYYSSVCNTCYDGYTLKLLKSAYDANKFHVLIALSDSFSNIDITNIKNQFGLHMPVIVATEKMSRYIKDCLREYFYLEMNNIIIEFDPRGYIVNEADVLSKNINHILGTISGKGNTP